MKINKLEMTNFKGVKKGELVPQAINVIVGPNGSGKTTFLEAVKTGINGKAPGNHIMAGKSNATLLIDISGVGSISREWAVGKPTKARLNGKITTQASICSAIEEVLGVDSDTVQIMSSTEMVNALLGEGLAKYLLKFIKNDMDFTKLVALCGMTADAQDELGMYLPAPPCLITLDDIGEAYQYYRDARTETQRAYDSAKKKAEYTGPTPSRSSEELSRLISDLGEKIGAESAAASHYTTALTNAQRVKANLESITGELDSLKGVKKPTATEVDNLKLAIKAGRELVATLLAELRQIKSQGEMLAKVLANLNEPICPISGKLVCTTDKTSVSSEIEEQIADLRVAYTDTKTRHETAAKDLAEMEKKMEETVRRDELYQRKISLLSQLEKVKGIKIEVPEPPKPGHIDRLRLQKGELEKEFRLAVAYEEARKNERKCESLEKTLAVYNELVELLSPKGGARKMVLEHYIAPFECYCNEKAKRVLPKYTVKLDCDNGLRLLFIDASGNPIPYSAISNGERLRALYILMDMLNALNGFRILLLDDIDGVDRDAFRELITLIQENESNYDHIFISAVNHEDLVEEAKKITGINLVEM